jgi:hypothetical protein
MAYKCPRCGDPVHRGSSSAVQVSAGLVGALIFAAFGSFQCKKCGKIAKSEFSPEDRNKMLVGSVALVGGAILVLIVVIVLLALINSC